MNEQSSRNSESEAAVSRDASTVDQDYHSWIASIDSALAAGALPDAEHQLRRLVAEYPDRAGGHLKLGEVLEASGQLEAARKCAERAIALKPDEFDGYFLKGSVLIRENRFPEAVLCFNHGVQLNPLLGGCISDLLRGFREEAVRGGEAVLARDPADFNSLLVLGRFRYLDGRAEESAGLLARALALRPSDANAAYCLSFAELALGRFHEGWGHYEARFGTGQASFPVRGFREPRWDGADLGGRTILLHAEQGIGDTLQFIRYASLVEERGGRVVVECQRPVRPLVEAHSAVAQAVAQGEPLPGFDVHVPLMSLPSLLHTTIETIPNETPYLSVPKGMPVTLSPRRPGCRRIGLVWAGNPGLETDLSRSITLNQLDTVLQLDGIDFYSLQVGPAACQIDLFGYRDRIIDLKSQLSDFARTAAAVAEMDLVLSVDTAVAHLAGALGAKVWLLLPYASEWRWLRDRQDCPWYPGMTLFRQPKPDHWAAVVTEIRDALIRTSGV